MTADWRNKKYLDFLKAGGSNYSLEILKQAGVDITTDKPYQMAFQHFNQLVSEMETIVHRLKKIKNYNLPFKALSLADYCIFGPI